MKSAKAQAWGFDLLIASVLFFIGMILLFFYSLNSGSEGQESLNSLEYTGNYAADIILSEGYPIDWNPSNVVAPGILSNYKINDTKLERFYDLSVDNYAKTKSLFSTNYNYYFNFSESMNIGGTNIEGIGQQFTNAKNLFKVTRFTVYRDRPTTFSLYVWE